MYVDIHDIISSENKTTAVKESGNSPSPAQVMCHLHNERIRTVWGYYTQLIPILQEDFDSHRVGSDKHGVLFSQQIPHTLSLRGAVGDVAIPVASVTIREISRVLRTSQ